MSFVKLGDLADLWIGETRRVKVHGRTLVVIRTEHGVSAFDDKCPHLGFPLSEGKLEGKALTCAAHGWCFDAMDGSGINPGNVRLKAYEVQVREDQIWIELSPASELNPDVRPKQAGT